MGSPESHRKGVANPAAGWPSAENSALRCVLPLRGHWQRGKTTVHVQPFPETGARFTLSAHGFDTPHAVTWSPDGQELFYDPRPGGFESVNVITTPAFAFGDPVARGRSFPGSSVSIGAVTPDPSRQLVIESGSLRDRDDRRERYGVSHRPEGRRSVGRCACSCSSSLPRLRS